MGSTTDGEGTTSPEDALHQALNDLLLQSLKALATAGNVEEACHLAGQACALYRQRDSDAATWNRYNVLLHRLARHAAGAHGQQDPVPP